MADIWWYEKRGCWCADVPSIEKAGKRARLYLGTDENEARRRFHEHMVTYHAHRPTGQSEGDSLSLFSLMARFLQWTQTNLSESTYGTYRCHLRTFIEEHGGRPAADIGPQDVEQHKAAIKNRGCKPRTINIFVQCIKRLYNWAVEQGLLVDNPIKNVKRVPRAPLQDRSVAAAPVDLFLQYAHQGEPLGDICEVLFLTGMRVGELLKLGWDDIDWDQKVARIYDHKTAGRGEQRPRTIPLNDRVLEILRAQQKVADTVFTNTAGKPFTRSALKCRKDRLERKHADMPHITFHQCRHTFATRLARAGVPERVAQEILGHSSRLTTRYYTTTPLDEMLDAVSQINGHSNRES